MVLQQKVVDRLTWLAAIVIAVVALVGVAMRLRYGVDLTDEAFYVALARRFAQGDHPFIDDWSALQLSGYFISPLVRAWTSVWGTEGIVLGFRTAYLVLKLLVVAAVFPFVSRSAGKPVAVAISAAFIALIPFLLPSMSYNTVAIAMLALAICCGALALRGSRAGALGCGFGFSVAAFVYPTLIAVGLAAAIMLLVLADERRVVWWALAGAVPVVALGVYVLVNFGSGIPDTLDYITTVGAYVGGGSKVVSVTVGAIRLLVVQPVMWGCALAVAVRAIGRKPLSWWVAPALLAGGAVVYFVDPLYVSLVTAVQLVVVCAVVMFVVGPLRVDREFIWVFMLGALALGFTAYTSSNGAINAGIGALAALIPALALAADRIRPMVGPKRYEFTMLLACGLIVAMGVHVAFTTCYRDEPPKTLSATVEAGPYAGMRTTTQRIERLDQLTSILGRETSGEDHLVAYADFSVGYLLSDARAAAPMLWLSRVDAQSKAYDLVSARLDDPVKGANVAAKNLEKTEGYYATRPRDAWVRDHFTLQATNDEAAIFRRESW